MGAGFNMVAQPMTARLFHCTTVNLRGDFWLWWPDAPFGARGDYASRKDAKAVMRALKGKIDD